MKNFVKFGRSTPVKQKSKNVEMPRARDDITENGIEGNTFTQYDHNVKFENIRAKVNITRTKPDDTPQSGVAKGAILDGVPITVPTNTAASTMHAMKKRCDFKPSLTEMEAFKNGHKLIMAKFDPLEVIQFTDELFSEYISKCMPGKAGRLIEGLHGHELRCEMDEKHVFAKQEALLKAHRSQPRIVYQGTDMYNAMTGPIVMELNNRMKKVFSLDNPKNVGNRAIYACGASVETLGDAMEMSVGNAVESDAKNNDGSQSVEFRRYEAMFYKKLGAPDWFVREFARTTEVRIWTRYGVAATVKGQRWSGETTTTTGNSYVHMALMQDTLERAGISKSTNIHGGDDYLGFVEGDVETFKRAAEHTYSVSGMRAEVVPQQGRHTATFYRKRYLRGTIGTRPVPQFGRVLSKLNLRPNRNTEIDDRSYMSGKYYSAAYEHRFVPGIRDVLLDTAAMLSDTPHFDVRTSKAAEMGGVNNIKRLVSGPAHSVQEMHEFLNQVYDIGYDELLETYQRSAASCVDYCDGWVVNVKGKWKTKDKSYRYQAPQMSGHAIERLTAVDV